MEARILGANGPSAKDAIPPLVQTLKNKQHSTRIRATIALGALGAEARAAVPALTGVPKQDECDQVRWLAAGALVRIAPAKPVVPLLIEAIKGPQVDDCYATEALGLLGPATKAAIPALGEALEDRNPGIRAASATALGQMGREARAAVPALTAALKEEDEGVRAAAAEAIKKIGQK